MEANLLKSAPMGVVLTLALLCSSGPDAASSASGNKRKEVTTIAPALLKPALSSSPERDPFGLKPAVSAAQTPRPAAPKALAVPLVKIAPPAVDLSALLRGLTLSATCVSAGGGTAIINGQLYGVGDHLKGTGDTQSLIVNEIRYDRVVLRREEQSIELVFADRPTRVSPARVKADKVAASPPPRTKPK